MSTSETPPQGPPQGPPLWIFWAVLAAAFAVTEVLGRRFDSAVDLWAAARGILGVGFLILLLWSAQRGGWLKGLLITLAVIALAFGICVVVVVSSFE